MTLEEFYERNAKAVWIVALLAPVVVLGVGLAADPYTFWDKFLWEDIWGPTVVDAEGWTGGCWGPDGAHQASRATNPANPRELILSCPTGEVLANDGYTITSEVTYGVILAAILYGVWRGLLKNGRVRTDGWFVLSLLPYILFGPTVRVLEDAAVFLRAERAGAGLFSYIFISPWIYIQIGIYAILSIMLGVYLRDRRESTSPMERLGIVAAVLAVIASVQSFAVNALTDEFVVIAHPAWAWGGALIGTALFAVLDRRGARLDASTTFVVGLPILAPTIGLLYVWATEPWSTIPPGYHYLVATYVLGFATAITLAAWLVGRFAGPKVPALAALALGVNLAIVFGHMVDGFATFLSLCSQPTDTVCTGASMFNLGLGNYGEKHPLSAYLLGVLNGWGFPLAKLLMVIGVIYLLDKEAREGSEADRQLAGLIQMAIFVLGIGPGLRDLLLVTFEFGSG